MPEARKRMRCKTPDPSRRCRSPNPKALKAADKELKKKKGGNHSESSASKTPPGILKEPGSTRKKLHFGENQVHEIRAEHPAGKARPGKEPQKGKAAKAMSTAEADAILSTMEECI